MGAEPFARAVLVLSLACSAACAAPSSPSTALTGVWGGNHISLTVSETNAHLELDCAHGDIPTRLPAAPFSVAGTFVREHGGPIREGEIPDRHPALYVVNVSRDTMTLTIRLTDSGEVIGTFTLTRGAAGRVVKCL